MVRAVVSLILMAIVVIGCNSRELPNNGNIWAVLVAGSNGYDNYRHQADVCHAYHILRKHGVPAENIITMMYDDIAYNPSNPFKGKIFNAVNGSDVYEGVLRDYIGQDVNATNFLKIITGDEEGMQGIGSGRVLKSQPNDHVFINFVDHGADYLVAFPSDELYAHDLLKAFMEMSEKNMFAKMVVYIEACESGSLFDNYLSDKLNIFAVTAAKRDQDSYACCWDPRVETYLGDEFSVNWMEDSDIENLQEETLAEQYSVVVQETNTSNPQEFGTLSIGRLPVGQFLGIKKFPESSETKKSHCGDAVSSPNVPIAILQRKLESADSEAEAAQIRSQIRSLFKLRRSVDHAMEHLLSFAYGNTSDQFIEYVLNARSELPLEKLPCYKRLAQHWFSNCYNHSTSPYALQKLHVFANICSGNPESSDKMTEAMDNICPQIVVKEGIQ